VSLLQGGNVLMKRVILVVSSLIMIVAISLGLYSFMKTPEKPAIELKKEVFIFEFGYSYSYDKTYYVSCDPKILNEVKIIINGNDLDYLINYDITLEGWLELYAVGQYEGVATYKNTELKFIVEIKDTTAPELETLEEIRLRLNQENVVFENYYYANDYSEVEIVVDSSKVNLAAEGSYEITVTAEDIYGNKTTIIDEVIVE